MKTNVLQVYVEVIEGSRKFGRRFLLIYKWIKRIRINQFEFGYVDEV